MVLIRKPLRKGRKMNPAPPASKMQTISRTQAIILNIIVILREKTFDQEFSISKLNKMAELFTPILTTGEGGVPEVEIPALVKSAIMAGVRAPFFTIRKENLLLEFGFDNRKDRIRALLRSDDMIFMGEKTGELLAIHKGQ